jgi:hypothetical protein
MSKLGFVTLVEQQNHQMVIGAIAKFHELLDQQFVRVRDADEFRRFLHADYQKLAISLEVTGSNPTAGCTLTLEHRTHAMSEQSRKQFARYWLAIKPGGSFVSQQLLAAVKRRAERLAKESSMRGKGSSVQTLPGNPVALPQAVPQFVQDPPRKLEPAPV